MDQLRRKRAPVRAALTKQLNSLNNLLSSPTSSASVLTTLFQAVEEKMSELNILSEKILEAMCMNEETSESDIQKEYDECDDYKSRLLATRFNFKEHPAIKVPRSSVYVSGESSAAQNEGKKTFQLPKIELVKFSGNVREWLQFWSLFKKIHEDINVCKEDKFQYLIQAMVPESRAAELVRSYPPTADNYDKVITSLKSRFGRDDLQIEVYVRELLQLVLQNALKPAKEIPLASLYDKIESYLRALESLGVTTDKCAAMLFPLVESSLPEDLLRVWQRSGYNNDRASISNSCDQSKNRLTQLIKFLESEVQSELRIAMAVKGFGLEPSESSTVDRTKKNKAPAESRNVPSARDLLTLKGRGNNCLFCEGKNHGSVECHRAKGMTLSERQDIVKKRGACFNCLKTGHNFRSCRVNVKCSKCSRNHADIMCFDGEKRNGGSQNDKLRSATSAVNVQKECSLASSSTEPDVFMQTLKVKLRCDTKEICVRAIIDSGSQRSYITREAAKQINYEPLAQQKIVHYLFGGTKSNVTVHEKYLIRLSNVDGSYMCNFEVLDQDVICADVPSITRGVWLDELTNLNVNLTDVCSTEESVSVLIGADVAGKLITGQRHVLECGLTAIETYLGWTLMGKVPKEKKDESVAITAIAMFLNNKNIADLWSLDILGIKDPIQHKTQSQRDQDLEKRFSESVVKDDDGRYEVKLPWLECHPEIQDNKDMAISRLQSVTKKLQASGMYEAYGRILEDWLKEGIIERVPAEEEGCWGHYLPHRPVFKENSTTAIRPVFDASAKGQQSPALNECLEKGPNLIELISAILLRFREGTIGVISDIRKAFLQIKVSPVDRDYLRFLWYDESGNINIYRHCRVVFGVCSSPFILGAIINLHINKILEGLSNNAIDFADTVKLKKSFYVDNCVTSVNDLTELEDFICNAKTTMESGGFDLRGWEYTKDGSSEGNSTVLGILWDKETDSLSLNTSNLKKLDFEKITKRNILSVAHRIFDPLGFICPVLLGPKLLLQKTWSSKLSWDAEVSDDIKERFNKWLKELQSLDEVKVPRCMVGVIDETSEISLHTFCDASKLAYATVIFIRVQRGSDIRVHFVQAKTRVAPGEENSSKRTSIPRLELLAATIGARLTVQVLDALGLKNAKVHYWTDSSTVVAWINRNNNWSVFVTNRIKEIRELSDCRQWNHIPGHLNPADLPSRGCTINQLLASKWWEGPGWLQQVPEKWPNYNLNVNEEEVNAELQKSCKSQNITLISTNGHDSKDKSEVIFNRLSNFPKVVRTLGWIKRFLFNCIVRIKARKEIILTPNETTKTESFLTSVEYLNAENLLLKLVQNEYFKDFDKKHIKHLLPFTDEQGLIRTKTKIFYREDDFNFRCPIILPGKNYIIELLIREKHIELSHAGVTVTLNALREKFWILGGRRVVREIIKKCVHCLRYDCRQIDVQPAPLPLNRVRDAAIFEIVGVDFAGPVYLKDGQKAWICLFTCAVYRAVHLELVSSLCVASFLMALRRHIARRGRPSVVYSDNGKNFVGMNNALKRFDFQKIAKIVAVQQIEWKFNPPAAPWWGGFWERLIGLLKGLLRRTLKRVCLDYEEMSTTLADCEAIINSRPITLVSDAHDEIIALTPSMFLQEIRQVGVIDLDRLETTDFNKRYMYRQKIKQNLRQRFRKEYLGALAHQKRKFKMSKEIKVGDIVLIGSDNTKRLDWPLALVKEVFVGKDGYIRVVKLKTATGELTRPVQRIYPLEMNFDTSPICRNHIENNRFIKNEADETKDIIKFTTRSGRVLRKPDRLNYN